MQDFYPTPGTASTVMFYTGLDPLSMKPVYVPRDYHEKQQQRALLQFNRPQNADAVREALRAAGREDLIGTAPHCLVRPQSGPHTHGDKQSARAPKTAQGKQKAPARGKQTTTRGKSVSTRGKQSDSRFAMQRGHNAPQKGKRTKGR